MADEQFLTDIAGRIKEENRREEERTKKRVRDAYREVERLKDRFLQIDPDMERLILFGSLSEDRVEHSDFDIDLAVVSGEYLKLLSCALNSTFPVDLVEYDRLPKNIRHSVDTYGIILYEKNTA